MEKEGERVEGLAKAEEGLVEAEEEKGMEELEARELKGGGVKGEDGESMAGLGLEGEVQAGLVMVE